MLLEPSMEEGVGRGDNPPHALSEGSRGLLLGLAVVPDLKGKAHDTESLESGKGLISTPQMSKCWECSGGQREVILLARCSPAHSLREGAPEAQLLLLPLPAVLVVRQLPSQLQRWEVGKKAHSLSLL